jgi:predicted small metal-binding protein
MCGDVLGEVLMLRQVRCECGYIARGESDDEVVALILSHIGSDHPDVAETETADDIRSWIELVPE